MNKEASCRIYTWWRCSSFPSNVTETIKLVQTYYFFYLSDTGNTTRRCLGKSKKTFYQIHSFKKHNKILLSLDRHSEEVLVTIQLDLRQGPLSSAEQSLDLPSLSHSENRHEHWVTSQCPRYQQGSSRMLWAMQSCSLERDGMARGRGCTDADGFLEVCTGLVEEWFLGHSPPREGPITPLFFVIKLWVL